MDRSAGQWWLRRHGHATSICARAHAATTRRRARSAAWRRHGDWVDADISGCIFRVLAEAGDGHREGGREGA